MATTDLMPMPTAAIDVSHHPALPSIADIQHRMTWMAEFRQMLVQYVETQMDPKRHLYQFDGKYAPIQSKAQIQEMLANGKKPAINQDGLHNLLALYDADVDDLQKEERRDGEGHYTVNIRLTLRYFGSRRAVGLGSCTTRESKYAYRWVYANEVPVGVDKGALRSRTYESRDGRSTYTRYRLDNDDLADVENTVEQIALKRAKSSAVKSLPGVSELFGIVGDPDEEPREDDAERQEVLRPLRAWLRGMKAATQGRALLAVFGEPLRANDVPTLALDRLVQGAQVLAIATAAGVQWTSPTLAADLQHALATSAAKAKADLWPEERATDPTRPEALRPTPPTSAQDPSRTILEHNRDNSALPDALLHRIQDALTPALVPRPAADLQHLASVVQEHLDALEGEEGPQA